MTKDTDRARACLDELDPRNLSYEEWLNVGMELKNSGCSVNEFDQWSRQDGARHNKGECAEKWNSFRGNGSAGITIASLVQLVRDAGGRVPKQTWSFDENPTTPMGWEDAIPIGTQKNREPENEAPTVIDTNWIDTDEIPTPQPDWEKNDFARYLEAMFESEEFVGIVTDTWFNERIDKWVPQKGMSTRTAGQLLEALNKCDGDIGKVIGESKPEVGAWIRINPLDGEGVRDENVTSFRHALLEAEADDVAKQFAIIKELELPCTTIVRSGNKSIHALVRVDAADKDEYRKRVDYLYKVAKKNGLQVDRWRSNRNPSGLARLPGISRNGKPQYTITGQSGKRNWADWVDWIEDLKDDLPDPQSLASMWDYIPELADELIKGVLRVGHKLLIVGPSKAGKSFALIQLCIAIAEGRKWMGLECKSGSVLYLNLELDSRSCWHRFKDVYQALGWTPDHLSNIDVWNLRGHSVPLDRLVPKLLRRAHQKGYAAVVIDPIYKVQTGDENSAEDMATFCNQFDKIAATLDAAVIYCHHHSKGSQGQKRSIDRAAGSGVFGRDPDAVLDFIELDIDKDRRKQIVSKVVCSNIEQAIRDFGAVPADIDELERTEPATYLKAAQAKWTDKATILATAAFKAREIGKHMSGWRIEGTLREFATPEPHSVWFNYPTHRDDSWGLLQDAKAAGEVPPWMASQKAKDEHAKDKADTQKAETEEAITACGGPGKATIKDIAGELNLSDDAARNRIKRHNKYVHKHGVILFKEKS